MFATIHIVRHLTDYHQIPFSIRQPLKPGDMVILDKDSNLIIAAFHSNCGGETSSSADVWLSGQPYLKSVTDPYCVNSRSCSMAEENFGKGLGRLPE